jgi:serine/threonine protein kinase
MITSGVTRISQPRAATAEQPRRGLLVGDYVLGRPIGDRGGTSSVFLAYHPELDRAVALKRLDAGDAGALLREARLTCSLAHPNVVTVHDCFVADGVPYMAMEYLRRGSLRRRVGQLGLAAWVGVLECALAGLQHAHERGVVHCDIKPENLLIEGGGAVKLADFGVARTALPTTGEWPPEALGTPLYMAPEQLLGRSCTPQADLYATGLVAYELLLARTPFPAARTVTELLRARAHGRLHAPPEVDPGVAEWLRWLLASAPADRPASARAAWERLEELAVGLLGPFWRRQARA